MGHHRAEYQTLSKGFDMSNNTAPEAAGMFKPLAIFSAITADGYKKLNKKP